MVLHLVLHPFVHRGLLRRPGDGVTILGCPVSHLPSFFASCLSDRISSATRSIRSHSALQDPLLQLLLRSCLGSCRLLYLLRSFPPLPDLIPPLLSFDTSLSKCLREDILGASQFFGELNNRLSSLPLSMGGLGITRATDILAFAFIALRHDTVELQNGLLAASALPPTDPALDTALARAPITVCTALPQLATGDGALVVPLPVPSASMGLVPRGSRSRRPLRVVPDCDEDSVSTTPSSQSLMAEHFFVTVAAQVLDGVEPSLVPRFRALLDCL